MTLTTTKNMILGKIYHLEEEAKEKIRIEKESLHSGAISEWEYKIRFENIMNHFIIEIQNILNIK